jgi:hypothetical protein
MVAAKACEKVSAAGRVTLTQGKNNENEVSMTMFLRKWAFHASPGSDFGNGRFMHRPAAISEMGVSCIARQRFRKWAFHASPGSDFGNGRFMHRPRE